MVIRHPLALLALAIGAASVTAGENPSAATQTSAADTLQGKRVIRDRESGKLRAPNDDELREMLDAEKAARRTRGEKEPTGPVAPLAVRQHPGGMLSAVLGPEYLVTLKAQRRPDGKLTITHSPDAHRPTVQPAQRPTE